MVDPRALLRRLTGEIEPVADRVYVEPTGRLIAPFNDPIGETPIFNRPLGDWQTEAFEKAGLERLERLTPPCLVVPDTLFTTGAVLAGFVRGAAGRDAVLVLGKSTFGAQSTPIQPGVEEIPEGHRFTAVRYVSGQGAPPVDVVIDPKEREIQIPIPRGYNETGQMTLGIPRHPVMTLHHWVHILWANQLGVWAEIESHPRVELLGSLVRGLLRVRSLNKWRLLGALNTIGSGADIHPTAVVEASSLGDNVTVGPHARVLFSKLGNGVSVMGGAQVEGAVLGAEATVSESSVLRLSVLYPEAVAAQALIQGSVLGRAAVTTKGSATIDLNFDGPVSVTLDGALVSTGSKFLGSAYGHRCRVGSGVILSSGRTIPNDYFLIRDPMRTLHQIPPGLEGQALNASGFRVEPISLFSRRKRR